MNTSGPGDGLRPSSPPTARTAKPAKSDSSWFSPRTGQGPGFVPECAVEGCRDDSFGGQLLQSLPGASVGKPRWLVKFYCSNHGPALSIFVSNLFQYRILGRRDLGVYSLAKLSETEQNHRAILREKDHGRLR